MTKQPITPRNSDSGSKRAPTPNKSSRGNGTTPPAKSGSSRSKAQTSSGGSSRSKATSSRSVATSSRSTRQPIVASVAPPPPPPEPRSLPPLLKVLLEDPDAFRKLRGHLPGWLDELLAAVLIGLGAVAFASLISADGVGVLSGGVAENLRRGFGDGAYLVTLSIIGLGLMILLPKIGLSFRFSWSRLIGLELLFISIQGLLHALQNNPEGQAMARAGQGGGYAGWAIHHKILLPTLGDPGSRIFYGLAIFIGLHLVLGIRRYHYGRLVSGLSQSLSRVAERIDVEEEPAPTFVPMARPMVELEPVLETPTATNGHYHDADVGPRPPQAIPAQPPPSTRRPSVLAQGSLTASRREAMAAPQLNHHATAPAVTMEVETSVMAENTPPPQDHSLRQPIPSGMDSDDRYDDDRPQLVINGQVVESSMMAKERPSIVPRDAEASRPKPPVMARQVRRYKGGRDNDPNKHYFTVDDLAERKKIGKRDESLPSLDILQPYDLSKPDEEEINRNASIIENTLLEFDIDADVIDVKVGPVVTQYAVSPIKERLNPATGKVEVNRVRVDRIVSLQGDLSLALSAKTLRIEAPVPGHSYVGIEVPNRKHSIVGLRPVIESEAYHNKRKSPLSVPLGRDVSGEAVTLDIATLPHLLVAGTTGSGKSVFLTSVVASLVMNNTPSQVKLLMLDPKRVELTRFNGLPHLMGPVETEADRIIGVLRWATREMDRRYKLMELESARNIDTYNAALGKKRKQEHLPYMVLIFDEIGDLMMSHPDETEGTITRLAQKARAAGIHLIIATQRPSTDILTGLIKANCPGRISFAVASGVDSRVILDYMGAETLLGRGDMLFLAPDAAGPKRIQGCFVSDEEVETLVDYWNNWREENVAKGLIEDNQVAPWERGLTRVEVFSEEDPMLEEAINLVVAAKEASTSMIQRRLGIGYPRAARLMDIMFELGVIGPPKPGGRAREVITRNSKDALKHLKKKL